MMAHVGGQQEHKLTPFIFFYYCPLIQGFRRFGVKITDISWLEEDALFAEP